MSAKLIHLPVPKPADAVLSPNAACVYAGRLFTQSTTSPCHLATVTTAYAARISEQCVAAAIYSNRCCNMQHDPYMPQKRARR